MRLGGDELAGVGEEQPVGKERDAVAELVRAHAHGRRKVGERAHRRRSPAPRVSTGPPEGTAHGGSAAEAGGGHEDVLVPEHAAAVPLALGVRHVDDVAGDEPRPRRRPRPRGSSARSSPSSRSAPACDASPPRTRAGSGRAPRRSRRAGLHRTRRRARRPRDGGTRPRSPRTGSCRRRRRRPCGRFASSSSSLVDRRARPPPDRSGSPAPLAGSSERPSGCGPSGGVGGSVVTGRSDRRRRRRCPRCRSRRRPRRGRRRTRRPPRRCPSG